MNRTSDPPPIEVHAKACITTSGIPNSSLGGFPVVQMNVFRQSNPEKAVVVPFI